MDLFELNQFTEPVVPLLRPCVLPSHHILLHLFFYLLKLLGQKHLIDDCTLNFGRKVINRLLALFQCIVVALLDVESLGV